jgi:hypothetical protein
MQSVKQYVLVIVLLLAGGILVWWTMPSYRRSIPGLLLGCVAVVAILAFSGSRHLARVDKYQDRYFCRCLTYDLANGQTVVIDNKSPRIITLDPSLVLIFGAADGQRTARQFIAELEACFPGGPPASIAPETHTLMAKMEAQGLIRFTDRPTQLPYYLSMPKSNQDKARALAEMKADGFIK